MTHLKYAGLTDVGRVRPENQDHWAADSDHGLFVVSDGMGGEAAGSLASQVVVEGLPPLVHREMRGIADLRAPEAETRLLGALATLSEQVAEQTRHEPGLEGMGATVVLALIRGLQAIVAYLGDSRAYLLRNGTLGQLTQDHSIVQLLLEMMEISPEEATNHPGRGRLTRFVGMPGEALPEAQRLTLCPGDRLLLCTDGLSGMLTDAQLAEILGKAASTDEACRALVSAANEAGGQDNTTVLVVDVMADGDVPLARLLP